MKLTGNYRLRPSIGGTLIAVETSTGYEVFATFDNSPAAQSAIGAFCGVVARDGGTVYDEEAKHFLCGPLHLLVEEPA